MRVLLLFPMQDGQTGPAIKYAFEQLGHKVIAVDAKLDFANSYNIVQEFLPHLVFCSRTWSLTEHIAKIKLKFKDVTVCMWNTDTRNSLAEWTNLFQLVQLCDYHFVIATGQLPEWRKLNPNTHWLPQGLQNEVYDKPKEITEEDRKKYECDVSFAGSCTGYHAWRVPYLEAIKNAGFNFKLWGSGFREKIYNEEHNKMVACSKINIGISGWPEHGKNISVRDYKIMGAGGFLLELDRKGLFDVLPITTLAYYENPDDLIDKISFCLESKSARTIRAMGHQWVHANATYTHRIQRALEIMGLK